MHTAITIMQADKSKRLDAMVNKDEAAKRTTISTEKDERDFIDRLIKEGKEPGIKPLISKMLDVLQEHDDL